MGEKLQFFPDVSWDGNTYKAISPLNVAIFYLKCRDIHIYMDHLGIRFKAHHCHSKHGLGLGFETSYEKADEAMQKDVV